MRNLNLNEENLLTVVVDTYTRLCEPVFWFSVRIAVAVFTLADFINLQQLQQTYSNSAMYNIVRVPTQNRSKKKYIKTLPGAYVVFAIAYDPLGQTTNRRII